MVIDRGKIAAGITARTNAHLAPLCDDLTSAMIGLRGDEISRLFYQSQAAAVDRIEEIQKREHIDCDFRRLDGYLFQALNTDSRSSTMNWTRSVKSALPFTGWSAFPLRIAKINTYFVIRVRGLFIH
jgi:glycine/D-amino acid oxidase-like deaminating enzyme